MCSRTCRHTLLNDHDLLSRLPSPLFYSRFLMSELDSSAQSLHFILIWVFFINSSSCVEWCDIIRRGLKPDKAHKVLFVFLFSNIRAPEDSVLVEKKNDKSSLCRTRLYCTETYNILDIYANASFLKH